jgi:DGQHR domain-containing protein
VNSYLAFLVKQRPNSPIHFAVFVADAKNVVKWAHADDIRIDRGNVQRALVESRWKQISKFFAADPNNVIPTSVTIAFDEALPRVNTVAELEQGTVGYHIEDKGDGLIKLTFPDTVVESSFVIDGQHRLHGMSQTDGEVRIPVCLFLSLPKLERAFQFVTINNKSHKVPTDNLGALIANFEQIQAGLRDRLTSASITTAKFATFVDVLNENNESPFHKMVDWVNNRFADKNPQVQPSALENSLRAIVRAFPETKDDEADALLVLNAIWNTIFAEYGVTSQNAGEFPNLMLKAAIQTLSEMIVDKLASDYDPAFAEGPITASNGAAAAKTAKNLVTGLPVEFWKEPWKLKSLDTSAGRELIERDIREVKKKLVAAKGQPFDWRSVCQLYKSPAEEPPSQ